MDAHDLTPGAGVTNYVYDQVDRVVAITDRESGTSRYAYDASGRLTAAIDANGEATRYAYNQRGWPTQVTDPLGGHVTRRYDALGRLVELTDQLGSSATAAYDAAGRLVERTDPAGRNVHRAYDVAGRLTSFGPADEEPTTIEYDALGRMVGIQEPGSFSNGLRWDAEDRLVERRRGGLAMRWAYDADGERVGIGYPDGTETTYTHDRGGYVVGAHHPALGTIDLERDEAGRLIGASADGMQALWHYEGGNLAQYEMRAGTKLHTARLTRDSIGRIVQATINGEDHRFDYDAAGQIVVADTPQGLRSFSYDANGRLTREMTTPGVVDYEYDAAGQLRSRVDAEGTVTCYEYDAAGYRVSEVAAYLERSYRWNQLGRLSKIERTGPDGEDRRSIEVAVDALGELAAVNGMPMLWDTAHPLVALTWHGNDAVIGEGSPWALASGDAKQWLIPDWQGTIGDTPRDPWGAPLTGNGLIDDAQLGYRGELEFDAEIWLRHRVYQPISRCFSQPDPLGPMPGMPSGANPYHYAANDPIGRSDPLGLHPVSERELQALRDRKDRNLLDWAADEVVEHSGDISAVTGVASVLVLATPLAPLAPALATISTATGGISAYRSYKDGDFTGMALDLGGVAISGAGAVKGLKAAGARRALKTTRATADETLAGARAAVQLKLPQLAESRYARQAELGQLAAQHGKAAHALERSELTFNYQGAYLGLLGMGRSHLLDNTGMEILSGPESRGRQIGVR